MIAARQIAFGKAAGGEPAPAYWGLCFTAEANSTVAMEAVGSAPAVSLETSYDGEIWEPFYVGETSITLNKGERVYFKAGEGGNTQFASSASAYNMFVLNGRIAASGSIMSLLDGDSETVTLTANYTFSRLFLDCAALTSAPMLPAITHRMYSYMYMFSGCVSLTAAPVLPAASSVASYRYMFMNCESLGLVELTATTWLSSRYADWLKGAGTHSVSTPIFKCPTALGTNETINRGESACPEGWIVINTD